MKSIIKFIKEGLKINKNTKVAKIGDYSNIEVPGRLTSIDLYYKSPSEERSHWSKMEGYFKKGSDPKRLVNSIKTRDKLLKRWRLTMVFDWEDAFVEFKDAIIDRGYYTEDQLRAYIQKQYVDKAKDEETKSKYEKYLTL